MDEIPVLDGQQGFARRWGNMYHVARLGQNAIREWTPRYDHPDEWASMGEPQFSPDGGANWYDVPLPPPNPQQKGY